MIYKSAFVFVCFSLMLSGCSKSSAPAKILPLVTLSEVESRDVAIYLDAIGHIEPFNKVAIKSQVTGTLMQAFFQDGEYVHAGDVLALIDPRPYEAALAKAEAVLRQNLASLQYSKGTAERNSGLVKDNFISQNDFENLMTNVYVGESVIAQNKADIETAKINLGYCTITAPIEGITSNLLVHEGNLILESDGTTLAVINQIIPIYAEFYIPEKNLYQVRVQSKQKELAALIHFNDSQIPVSNGVLDYINNTVDEATGMVRLRAVFANEDQLLWPGEYAVVRLILDTIKDAILIPTMCVQQSQDGPFVYLYNAQTNTVDMRKITLGQKQDDDTQVVLSGLSKGDKIVLEGQLNLFPGAAVRLHNVQEAHP